MDLSSGPSLRRQLVFRLLFPLVTVLLLSAIAAYMVASDFAAAAYDRSLYDSALDLSRRIRPGADGRFVADVPKVALEMLESDEFDRVYYNVRGPHGRLLLGNADLPLPPQVRPRRPIYYEAQVNGQRVRLVAIYAPLDIVEEDMLGLVIVGETQVKRRALANEVLATVALSQALLIVLACVSVYSGIGNGLAPLERLRRAIARRSHRDLAPLDEPRTPREVRPLVHAINGLMARLAGVMSAQQRFVADAAHQLRTPLAGLKTHAELALREETMAGVHERLVALIGATDRAAHLANQLLALARAEPEASGSQPRDPVDIDRLARATTTDWVPRALQREIDLGYAGAAVSVLGNAVLLRELLSNLIDNAVRYGRAGGRVTVAVDPGEAGPVLSVEDDGPGVAPEHRERVFERFQRLDLSRPEGCGLGLAIVREIAEAHGARVTLGPGRGGAGTRVEVAFPAAPRTAPRDPADQETGVPDAP